MIIRVSPAFPPCKSDVSCPRTSRLERHPLDVFISDIGIEIIKLYVKKPLDGLRIANYYGCQLIRPERGFDAKENPLSMENLFESIGAEEMHFSCKLKCCGGMLMTTFEEAALKLTAEILQSAKENDADCIATTCPLCQMNLEAYQKKIKEVNSGVYAIDTNTLALLKEIQINKSKGEYYLTDIICVAYDKGIKTGAYCIGSEDECRGVNTQTELEKVRQIIKEQIRN